MQANPIPRPPDVTSPEPPPPALKRTAPLYEPGHGPMSARQDERRVSSSWLFTAGVLMLILFVAVAWYLLGPR
ncbi:MAG TPA: hypothetical protein VF807_06385 [Ktedonobacterales bacterium]